jgi:hypothetical protein
MSVPSTGVGAMVGVPVLLEGSACPSDEAEVIPDEARGSGAFDDVMGLE